MKIIYADDITLISSEIDTHKTTSQLNTDLLKMSSLANKWKVKFNASKSSDLIFSEHILNNSLVVLMDQVVSNRVGYHKHLVITLTCNLSWDSHATNVVKQANFKMSLLYAVLDLLYKMNIRSRMDYCNTLQQD